MGKFGCCTLIAGVAVGDIAVSRVYFFNKSTAVSLGVRGN